MNLPGLILIGAGGHARACIDVIEQEGRFEIAGLVGTSAELHTRQLGYEVFATDDELAQLAARFRYALVTTGQIGSPELRMRMYNDALRLGFELPVIVAPSAHVSPHASIGAGSVVMHGAVVNAGATVGRNCIINTRALVEHDATVGEHCHISTAAVLNGAVSVGAGSFIGSGSVVKQGVTVGQRCIVGMGLALRHNQPDHARFLG